MARTTTAHSPAPWTAPTPSAEPNVPTDWWIRSWTGGGVCMMPPGPTAAADAAVISQAPAMLAALRDLSALECDDDGETIALVIPRGLAARIRAVHAALRGIA